MYKVLIKKRYKEKIDDPCEMFRVVVSFDLAKPAYLTDEEWDCISGLVKELSTGEKPFLKDVKGPGCLFDLSCLYNDKDWGILAESEHFYIMKDYEDASIYRKTDSEKVACVGDFYGDPEDAYIDPSEKFCITIGCGIIKYYLTEPFEIYMYNRNTPQWVEAGREGNIEWCDKIEEVTDSYILVSLEGEEKRKFDINTLKRIPM